MRTGMRLESYLHRPDVILLFQPASELDQTLPQALRAVSGYIEDSAAGGNGDRL